MNTSQFSRLISSIQSRPWLLVAFLLACLSFVLFVIYIPLSTAGFYSDDWTFLALSRHGDGPLGFFVYDHSFTYMYRPVAMSSWWATTQIFGLAAAGHYLFASLIHLLTASLAVFLLLRLQVRLWCCVGLGALLIAHPTSAITVAWLADRFDLLMSFGVMLGLVGASLLRDHFRLSVALMLLASLVALCSKETGLALMPLLALGIWFGARERRVAVVLIASFVVLGLVYFLARKLVLGSLGGIAVEGGGYWFLWYGVKYWFLHLPQALVGVDSPYWLGVLILLFACVMSVYGFVRGSQQKKVVIAQLVLLVVMVAVLQSPVTQVILQQDEPFRSVVNFRFFYLGVMALLALIVLGLDSLLVLRESSSQFNFRFGAAFALVMLSVFMWGALSRAELTKWSAWTGADERMDVLLATAELAVSPEVKRYTAEPMGCLVRLVGAKEMHTDLPGYSDLMVKALLPPGSAAVDCIFATEVEPWKAMTQWQTYQSAGADSKVPSQREYSFRSGRLAVHAKTNRDAANWEWRLYQYVDGAFELVIE